MTCVINLSTEKVREYDLPPRRAVVNAYAQVTKRDFNWWTYGERGYDDLIVEGKHTFSCGDWCVLKNPHEFSVAGPTRS